MIKKYKLYFSGRDFFRDVSYTVVGQSIVMILMLLMNKIISHYFSPAEYTIFSIANRSAGVLAMLMLFSLGIALPAYLAKLRTKHNLGEEANLFYSSIFMMALAIVAVSLPTLFFRNYLASLIFNDQRHAYLILPMLIFAISITLSSFVYSYFRGVDRFRTYNIVQIVAQLASVLIVIFSGANLMLQLTLRGTVIGLISAATIFYLAKYTYKHIVLHAQKTKKYSKELAVYCLPRVPGELFLFAYGVVPLIIINTRFGSKNSAAFATALVLNAFMTPVFQFIGLALLPYASKNLANGKIDGVLKKIRQLTALYMVASLVSVIILFIFTGTIIGLLFNQAYVQFAGTVRIVSLSVIPYALYLLLRNPLDAISRIPFNTINLAISFIFLNVFLLFSSSLLLCSIAFPVSYAILGILSEAAWWRCIRTKRIELNNIEVAEL